MVPMQVPLGISTVAVGTNTGAFLSYWMKPLDMSNKGNSNVSHSDNCLIVYFLFQIYVILIDLQTEGHLELWLFLWLPFKPLSWLKVIELLQLTFFFIFVVADKTLPATEEATSCDYSEGLWSSSVSGSQGSRAWCAAAHVDAWSCSSCTRNECRVKNMNYWL